MSRSYTAVGFFNSNRKGDAGGDGGNPSKPAAIQTFCIKQDTAQSQIWDRSVSYINYFAISRAFWQTAFSLCNHLKENFPLLLIKSSRCRADFF